MLITHGLYLDKSEFLMAHMCQLSDKRTLKSRLKRRNLLFLYALFRLFL